MELPNKIILPCGNVGILDKTTNTYLCNYCWYVVGSKDEPSDCRKKREDTEPYKNDYWMNINDEPGTN